MRRNHGPEDMERKNIEKADSVQQTAYSYVGDAFD